MTRTQTVVTSEGMVNERVGGGVHPEPELNHGKPLYYDGMPNSSTLQDYARVIRPGYVAQNVYLGAEREGYRMLSIRSDAKCRRLLDLQCSFLFG